LSKCWCVGEFLVGLCGLGDYQRIMK
jgi:hypothetical protein